MKPIQLHEQASAQQQKDPIEDIDIDEDRFMKPIQLHEQASVLSNKKIR
jgi:hypothetical protein